MSSIDYLEQPWHGDIDPAQFASEVLLASDGDTPLKVEITGACPRCADTTSDAEYVLENVAGFLDTDDAATLRNLDQTLIRRRREGQWTPPSTVVVNMICTCDVAHGAPPGRTGCGSSWALEVALS